MWRLEVENVSVRELTRHPAQLLHGVASSMEQKESGLHLVPNKKVVAGRTDAERTLCHWLTPKVTSNLRRIANILPKTQASKASIMLLIAALYWL